MYRFSKQTYGSDVEFFTEGKKYFSFYIHLIDQAKHTIHLQTYIFKMDSFGSLVHAALIRAAQRGVKVYLLIDSVGSNDFSTQHEELLQNNNILVCRFNRFNYKWFYQWGRRLHHKILVADHQLAIIGGINVTTSGYGNDSVATQQLDFAVSLKGPVVDEISQYCQYIFKRACQKKIRMNPVVKDSYLVKPNDVSLRISINDWVYRRWHITKSYELSTQHAQKEITIIN